MTRLKTVLLTLTLAVAAFWLALSAGSGFVR